MKKTIAAVVLAVSMLAGSLSGGVASQPAEAQGGCNNYLAVWCYIHAAQDTGQRIADALRHIARTQPTPQPTTYCFGSNLGSFWCGG